MTETLLKSVTIVEDIADPESWIEHHVADIAEFLQSRYDMFPETAKIYHEYVAATNDVTPNCQAGIDRLGTLPGPFCVIIYPEDPTTIGYIIVAIVAAIVAVALTANASIPQVKNQSSTPSPNNDLASRQNSARPFARIPDIYGTVRSTPDLIQLPYSVYENNIEVEHAYMCIGRGKFVVSDVRDDTTPLRTIDGARCQVFDPFSSPNTVGPYTPNLVIGAPIDAVPLSVVRNTSVNGQDLLPTNAGVTIASTTGSHLKAHFDADTGGGHVNSTDADLTTLGVTTGDLVHFEYSATEGSSPEFYGISLSGIYTVVSVTSTVIYFSDVQSVNSQWDEIDHFHDHPDFFSIEKVTNTANGPFVLTQPDQTEIWLNIVATNGLYKIASDNTVTAVNVSLSASVTPLDSTGGATADPTVFTFTLNGSAAKGTVAGTWKITLPVVGPCSVTVRRTTASPSATQVVDGVKWKDLYSITPVTASDFGNVTTVYAVTKATQGALSVKQRKLNMLVTRLTPTRTGSTFSTAENNPSNSIADVLCFAALDPFIGNRSAAELDVTGIFNTADAITAYFGEASAQEFCHTFDSSNVSFEEIVFSMAAATFCTVYRQGNFLRLGFEKATPDSVMLFNHRNKLPGTETRTFSFGQTNDFDSVEYNYISPVDDSKITLYIPSRGVNPQKVDSVGVRNYHQAYWQAWRTWNKLKYSNTALQFTALQEASLLLMADRIMVADNTRSGTQDGDVISQNVLELELSQPVVFATGKSYQIFLQGIDGLVESIGITPGSNSRHVVLAAAPTVVLSLDADASVRTVYGIVANDDLRPTAFQVTKREPDGAGSFSQKVTCINYSDHYYSKDGDGIAGTIPANPDA